MKKFIIYTDGSCLGNNRAGQRKGGWGYILFVPFNGVMHKKEGSGNELNNPTNNRMELVAVLKGLEEASLHNPSEIIVRTDSRYVQEGMSRWLSGWKKNGWITKSKNPVMNRDLWIKIDGLCSRMSVTVEKVDGHSGDKWNERCDILAKEGAGRE